MPRRCVAEMSPGEQIDSQTFLVTSKDLRTTTSGSLYIHAVLADRTGQVVARAWSASEAMYEAIPTGGFINVKGRTESYKGNLQFIIEAIRPMDPGSLDLAEFLPRTSRDIDEMWKRTRTLLQQIKDPFVATLVKEFLTDEDLMRLFRAAPAARDMHHAYIGGLLEHTLNLLEVGSMVIPRYPRVSLDLVLAGLFLHDLGKTAELGFSTNFEYTDEGQLLGHITICVNWIEQKAAKVAEAMGQPFPDKLKWALQHIVLSHHGKTEFGSPKVPALPEAYAVHYLDNLDAKLDMSLNVIDTDNDKSREWTNYHRGLETKLYKLDVITMQARDQRP